MLNVTEVYFRGTAEVYSPPLYQWDYGQILKIMDVNLPTSYEVQFSTGTETVTSIGDADGVTIPDICLTYGRNIHAYIFLHQGTDDGETEFHVIIPVIAREEPTDIEPTPVQQDVITQAIALLNTAVEDAQGYAIDAKSEADRAEEIAETMPEDVLSYAPQTLTDEEKAQARANIGAISSSEIPASSVTSVNGQTGEVQINAVLYDSQSLTASQRRQAVTNITAVSYDVQSLSTIQRNTARNNIKAISADELNEAILASLITDTASGDPCAFPDGASAPVVDCTVAIMPKQEGSGTPSPSNVRPISGWTEMTMKRTGMNVFDLASAFDDLGVTYTVDSDGWVTVENLGSPNLYSNHMPMPYTVTNGSVVMELHSDTTATNFRVRVYSGSTAVAQGTKIENKTFDNIGFDWGNIGKVKFKLMVVNSKTVGDVCYPYEEQTYTKSWDTTVYGGSLDLTTGVLTVTYGMVDISTLTWTYVSGLTSFECKTLKDVVKSNTNLWCTSLEHAPTLTAADWSGYDKVIGINKNDSGSTITGNFALGSVCAKDSDYTTVSDFATAMNGVQLCYELAEPTTIQLTPTQVDTILGSNTFSADTGSVTVEYRADTKLYIQKVIGS